MCSYFDAKNAIFMERESNWWHRSWKRLMEEQWPTRTELQLDRTMFYCATR